MPDPAQPTPAPRLVRRLLLVNLGLWTSIAMVEATHYFFVRSLGPDPVTLIHALKVSLLRWWLWAVLTPAVWTVSGRYPLERGRILSHGLVHIVAATVFTAADLIIGGLLYYRLAYTGTASLPQLLQSFAGIHSAMALITYGAIVGAHLAWTNHQRMREREIEAARLATESARLEHRLSEARLVLLRNQLQPHFLFNTLHGVSGLVLQGATEDAIRMISLLSDLLRLSLDDASTHVVPLAREVEFLEVYCDIQRIRFRDRLVVRRRIPLELLDAEVPVLLLQPLAENAVRHGLERIRGQGVIEIRARRRRSNGTDWLDLSIMDSGPGPDAAPAAGRRASGVGLSNTRARLRALYGANGRLALVQRPEGGCEVRVRIPLHRTGTISNQPRAADPGEPESAAPGPAASQRGARTDREPLRTRVR